MTNELLCFAFTVVEFGESCCGCLRSPGSSVGTTLSPVEDLFRGMAEQVAQRIENGLHTDDGRTAAELIEAADQQLYRRKGTENKGLASAVGRILHTKKAGR